MKPLKIYVGLDNRFVLCERFPDDEEHAGLHEMLDFMVEEDPQELQGPLEQGFYMAHFTIEVQDSDFNPDYDAWLEISKVEPINDDWNRSAYTQEEIDNIKRIVMDYKGPSKELIETLRKLK